MLRTAPLDDASIDTLIATILRGASPAWPVADDTAFCADFQRRARYNGVAALLNECLQSLAETPSAITEGIRQQALAAAFWEMRHQDIIAKTLAALAGAGITPILLKGTALAYGLYTNPVCRQRGDTDMIIDAAQTDKARVVLAASGFRHARQVSGELISYQDSFSQADAHGFHHAIDLHWRISNSEVLSKLFTYQELRAQAVPVPALGGNALAAGRVHALLLACFHRSTHIHNPYYVDGMPHFGGDRLIWIYDIHLLASAFTAEEWRQLARLAGDRGLCAVTRQSLVHARTCFGTELPSEILSALDRTGERVAVYLAGSNLRQHWMDFRAVDGIGRKLRLLREMVFPPPAYMREKYSSSTAWLPWLYLRRATEGLRKRLASHG